MNLSLTEEQLASLTDLPGNTWAKVRFKFAEDNQSGSGANPEAGIPSEKASNESDK